MKVKGMIESDVDTFKVGDVIEVKLADGVKVQAMAVQQEEDGMVFCLVDCLPSEHPMNSTSTNEGGYEESDLRKKLNGEILNLFPAELKAMMTPFDNGDLLRLPTEKEIFGENYYGEYCNPCGCVRVPHRPASEVLLTLCGWNIDTLLDKTPPIAIED